MKGANVFTGIIHQLGTIVRAEKKGDLRIRVECDLPLDHIRIGDSIACNGCCLTVVEIGTNTLDFTLSEETLSCTAVRWGVGDKLHLEQAARLGDRLDGHLVSGHIDGLATIVSITPSADSHVVELLAPPALSRLIAAKGSVTLDGISLTVNRIEGERFWVNIIPYTWQATCFHERRVGDRMNLEIDLIARYVERLLGKMP